MDFYKIEDGKLVFYEKLGECRNCHKPMLGWWQDVPDTVMREAKKHGVEVETYQESGVCGTCSENGGFSRACDCCHVDREFPNEFKYQLTKYAEYPEGDTEYNYICTDCVQNKAGDVINMMAESDNISEVKPPR